MSPLALGLFQAHASALRGFYFDAVSEPRDGLFLATSNTIEDPFWNYAFGDDDVLETHSGALPDIFSESSSTRSRTPAVLLPDGSALERSEDFLSAYSPFADDLWMVADTNEFSRSSSPLAISRIESPEDRSAAVEVFADAYTTESDDGIGYTGLPEEYTRAFSHGLARAELFGSDHLIGRVNGDAVAVASVFYAGGAAGLYSVAVGRDSRLRGYGKAISTAALELARSKARLAFLQTEPGSAVQRMYEGVGFSKLVHARLWSKPSAA